MVTVFSQKAMFLDFSNMAFMTLAAVGAQLPFSIRPMVERIRNTPISEQAITGIAIGAAVAGLRPVMEIMFMDFITLAVDQMVNLAAKLHPIYGQKCPMVLRTPPGAGRGYGATHSQSLERLFLGTPGIKVVAPSNAGMEVDQNQVRDCPFVGQLR